MKAAAKALESAVKAVESSKLDKTVADADGLYKATEAMSKMRRPVRR